MTDTRSPQQQQQQEGMQKFAEARKKWKAELQAEEKKLEDNK